MIYSVYVLPNSSDNWATTSPFSPALSAGQLGYVFSNTTVDNTVNYKLISSKLLDISDIDQSVDIFSGASKDIKAGIKIKGIGGVASSGDFSFTLESSGIVFNKLLGRTVKVAIDLTNSGVNDIGTSGTIIKLVGKIRKVKPKDKAVEFSCNGLLATLKEKEIGTVTQYESDVYKSKIIPIVYGDMTDANAMVRTVLDKNVKDSPNIIVDNEIIYSLDSVLFWDDTNKKSIKYSGIDVLDVSANRNSIGLAKLSNMTILNTLDLSTNYIELYNPSKIAFEFSTSPTLDTTSVYSFSGFKYRFIEVKDGYYMFDIAQAGYEPTTATGTLTKVSGTGSASLIFTWHSDTLFPDYDFEQSGDDNNIISPRAKPFIVKVAEENLLITDSTVYTDGANSYIYTRYDVNRGWGGTTKTTHAIGEVIYVFESNVESQKWVLETIVWASGVSNFWNTRATGQFVIPADLLQLTSMSRTGVLGSDISFSVSNMDIISMYMDLQFPKISLKADVIDAYVLGKYYTDSNVAGAYPCEASIGVFQEGSSIIEGHIRWWRDGYPYDAFTRGSGLGRFLKRPRNATFYNVDLPYIDYAGLGDLFTVSTLASTYSSSLQQVSLNSEGTYPEDRKCYSLKNNIEKTDGIFYRNAILGEIESFLNSGLTLRLYHGADNRGGAVANSTFTISNPGLLLILEVSPLESEVFVQCGGRCAIRSIIGGGYVPVRIYETPNEILDQLLYTELSFSDVTDNVTDRLDWKQAFAITGDVQKFDSVAQAICEQGGIILSDGIDGTLNIDSLSVPEDSSALESIALGDVLTERGVIDYTEEWTTIERLITDITLLYQYNDAGEFYGQVTPGVDVSDYTSRALAVLDGPQKATVELSQVRDGSTANKLATLIMQYSSEPLRILNMRLKFSKHTLRVGQWVTCNVVSSGKIYLITKYSLNFNSGVEVSMIEVDDPNALYNTTDSANIYVDTTDSTNILQGE